VRLLRSALVGLALGGAAVAQEPPAPAGQPPQTPAAPGDTKPLDLFRSFRDVYLEGQYEVAAELLKSFLAANPTDEDILTLERKYGAAFALSLRNLTRWSENPKANDEAKKAVEALVDRTRKATEKLTKDPKRILTHVRNLAGSPAEQAYAIDQLKRAGDAAVPVLVETLRATSSIPQQAGIMTAITKLGPETVQPFLAAAEALPDELKEGMIKAVAYRPDVLNLMNRADTDPTPLLWYLARMPEATAGDTLRTTARTLIGKITPNFDRRSSADELTRLALPITQRKAVFAATDTVANRVKVWTWDAAANNVKPNDDTVAQAEEYYAVRNLRWAVERDPNYEPAQRLLLGFVTERAVERGRFMPPDKANPAAYTLLAAAVAVLKVPAARPNGAYARVVDVLRRALAADPGNTPPDAKGKAVVVDPSPLRSGRLAGYLRDIGYIVEVTTSNRDLIRRVHQAADVDLFVIDRHAADPELRDTLATMTADAAGRKPVLVVASSDKKTDVPLEALLLRLALLVAATETDVVDIPVPVVNDPRKDEEQNALLRREILKTRDQRLEATFKTRLARLRRLVDAAALPPDPALKERLDLRLPQLTYAVLAAEYPFTEASAPAVFKQSEMISKILASRVELTKTVANVRTDDLRRLIEQLETVLTPELNKNFEALRLAVDSDALGIARDTTRDPVLEEKLTATVRPFRFATVIPEPLSPAGLTDNLRAAVQDPADVPRSPAEKAASAKLAAEWLRKLAVGNVPGYDVAPAGPALRAALRSDELGPIVVDAVARLSSQEAQQDLLNVALGSGRPTGLRVQAAEETARHAQQFGPLATAAQKAAIGPAARDEKDPELKGKLAVLYGYYAGTPADFSKAVRLFNAQMIEPPAPAKPKDEKAPVPEGDAKPEEAKPDKK